MDGFYTESTVKCLLRSTGYSDIIILQVGFLANARQAMTTADRPTTNARISRSSKPNCASAPNFHTWDLVNNEIFRFVSRPNAMRLRRDNWAKLEITDEKNDLNY